MRKSFYLNWLKAAMAALALLLLLAQSFFAPGGVQRSSVSAAGLSQTGGLPDLRIRSATVEARNAPGCSEGSRYEARVVVENIGTAPAAMFAVRFANAQQTIVEGLAAGRSVTVYFSLQYSVYSFSAQVDSYSTVAESDENNNSYQLTAPTSTLTPPCPTAGAPYTPTTPPQLAQPDLVVSAIAVKPIAQPCLSSKHYQAFVVNVSITNRGKNYADSFNVLLQGSQAEDQAGLYQLVGRGLGPGQTVTVGFGYRDSVSGVKTATADSQLFINESDEANNSLSKDLGTNQAPGAPIPCPPVVQPSIQNAGFENGLSWWRCSGNVAVAPNNLQGGYQLVLSSTLSLEVARCEQSFLFTSPWGTEASAWMLGAGSSSRAAGLCIGLGDYRARRTEGFVSGVAQRGSATIFTNTGNNAFWATIYLQSCGKETYTVRASRADDVAIVQLGDYPTPTPTKGTPTVTRTATSTAYPGKPILNAPQEGALLKQPLGRNEWIFGWSARTGPCTQAISIVGPGSQFIFSNAWQIFNFRRQNYLPDGALGPWFWSSSVSCPLGGNGSEERMFWVEPGPTNTRTPTIGTPTRSPTRTHTRTRTATRTYTRTPTGPTATRTYTRTATPTNTTCACPTRTPTGTSAPAWNPNSHPYAVGDLVSYNGRTYRCVQAHTSQPGWTPEAVPALWQPV